MGQGGKQGSRAAARLVADGEVGMGDGPRALEFGNWRGGEGEQGACLVRQEPGGERTPKWVGGLR